MYKRVFIGLGTNIGDRKKNLVNALRKLKRAPFLQIVNISSIYETEAMYNLDLPDFYNMVIEIETRLEPEDLLSFLKKIEVEMGRDLKRQERYEPRIIDLDIITFQDTVVRTDKLTIPHEGMWERGFVLIPLQEIAPDYVCPVTGMEISEMVSKLDSKSREVKKIGSVPVSEL